MKVHITPQDGGSPRKAWDRSRKEARDQLEAEIRSRVEGEIAEYLDRVAVGVDSWHSYFGENVRCYAAYIRNGEYRKVKP